jgi:hypothetical protein
MTTRPFWLTPLLLTILPVLDASARAAEPFADKIRPFLTSYCLDCHGEKKAEAELNLARYTSTTMLADDFRQWEHVVTFLKSGEMPPETAKQPSDAERAAILSALSDVMLGEARKMAGDPGAVLPRRLSNAEYNYSVRDLTGFDIRPADSFPVDPASGEGFSNTGEALLMSPSLFKKYYNAAQFVADHIDFTPSGWAFAPYPVSTYADQKKYHEQAILNFYQRHAVDYESYLAAAMTHRQHPEIALVQLATQRRQSPRYLISLWNMLSGNPDDARHYQKWLRLRWQSLPTGDNATQSPEIKAFARDLSRLGEMLTPRETEAIVSNAGNGPIQHIERRNKTARSRDTFNTSLISDARRFHLEIRDLAKKDSVTIVLQAAALDATDDGAGFVILKDLNFTTANADQYKPNDDKRNLSLSTILKTHAPEQWETLSFGKHPFGDVLEASSIAIQTGTTVEFQVPRAAFANEKNITFYVDARLDREHSKSGLIRFSLLDHAAGGNRLDEQSFPLVNPDHASAKELRESCQSLCQVFPNRFFYVDDTRGLSAGFHLTEGFFRDDQPLCRHVLSDQENEELDRLWNELEFGTQIAEKMLRGFVFFERSERNFMKHPDFDAFKEEDPELAREATVLRLEQAYFKRSGVKGSDEELVTHPIHMFFADIRDGLRQRTEQLHAARPLYLKQLEAFAQRASRRPLSAAELQQVRDFYQKLCDQPEYGIERAVRASVVRLLVSPHFCYRIDPAPAGDATLPLSDLALASRLSFFLWSSMPDDELLAVAADGKLHDPRVLAAQTQRMLKDPKVSGFALEFLGPWLRYRDFLEQESVSRELFPMFDAQLKQSMFEEPTRLATHLIQQNRPVSELLNGDTTLVNRRLAQHYGLPFNGGADDWTEVSGLHGRGRSGLLGMAVFLTKNSQPQRTSPVKRGFWVVHHLLGEHIPAPPADVVALPAKETETQGKTIRQLLALHTDDFKCARCHRRFDAVGLSMEGFDAIGRRRDKDLAGRAVDDLVDLPTGKQARGVAEYSQYLAAERADDFNKTLCRKLLGYALGRSVQLSDQPLLDTMQVRLKEDGRFHTLFEVVISSPQFRNQRCRDFSNASYRLQVSGD